VGLGWPQRSMSAPLFASPSPVHQPGAEPETAPPPGMESRVFRRGREAASLLLVAGSLFVTLALASFQADPAVPEVVGADWVGPVGAWIARSLVASIGIVAWAVPIEMLLMAVPLFRDRPSIATIARIGGDLLAIFILSALVHVSWAQALVFGAMPIGGSVGELFGELMRSLFSTVGSYIIGLTAIGLILIARASFSFISFTRKAGATTGAVAGKAAGGARALRDAWARAKDIESKRAGAPEWGQAHIDTSGADRAIIATLDDDVAEAARDALAGVKHEDGLAAMVMRDDPTPSPSADDGLRVVMGGAEEQGPAAPRTRKKPTKASSEGVDARAEPQAVSPADAAPADAGSADAEPAEAQPKGRRKPSGPTIVDTSQAALVEKVVEPAPVPESATSTFELPSFDLLEQGGDERLVIDEELQAYLNENAAQLVTTLNYYGVRGQIREIQPGPTVTTYELEPEAGTKVSKIAGLADDLAMNLGCQVRIVAPIPGKKRVGFEVPNRTRTTVNLRELIEDRRFQEMKAPLPVVLGRDIVGAPFYADLASMPHVLVAGATGAGKSVGINVMLVSLLYRRTPEDLRLLMIDPKVVELQAFDRMPHMLLPVVTDMRQAANALKWAVDEMERRYQLLANAGTKNIKTYNAWVEKVSRGEVRGYAQPKVTVTTAPDGSMVELGPQAEPVKLPEKMPYIVIVIDEFADLMMQQGKDVEASIARLAQKARAAGMHVILATQRPSVDVITGMIKANFPTRVAFKVTQRIDSRTILDEQGAEHLLGRGDMLVKINGVNETKRVQCPFVSEEEVEAVTAFIRRQGEPTYDESILRARDDDGDSPPDESAEQDPKYDEAVQIVAETRRCSTSWIQRKLGIGYNRAAKIVEMMEKRGLVGPAQGAKDREVLVDAL